jgi:creatinine amidohydrolase
MSALTKVATSTRIGWRIKGMHMKGVRRRCNRFTSLVLLWALASGWSLAAQAVSAPGQSVFVEALSWTDLKAQQARGVDTVLVPIGGTEQNGPHMVLGKHNVRVKVLAGQIAQKLGRAVVAPVLAYVPEGSITPPAAHMRFTGTISISSEAFESVLTSTAKSFKQHGFRYVVFMGDHGGYQKSQEKVAARLNKDWAKEGGSKALALTQYYEVAQEPYNQLLREKGYATAEIGTHAGLADTALAMAVDPALVYPERLVQAAQAGRAQGVLGDPRRATPALGQLGVSLIVDNSVKAIQKALYGP